MAFPHHIFIETLSLCNSFFFKNTKSDKSPNSFFLSFEVSKQKQRGEGAIVCETVCRGRNKYLACPMGETESSRLGDREKSAQFSALSKILVKYSESIKISRMSRSRLCLNSGEKEPAML